MWRLEVETRGVEQVESRVFLAGLDQNLQPVGGDNSPTMFSPSVRLPWLLYDVERIFQIVDGCHSTAHPGPALEVDVKLGESVLNHNKVVNYDPMVGAVRCQDLVSLCTSVSLSVSRLCLCVLTVCQVL